MKTAANDRAQPSSVAGYPTSISFRRISGFGARSRTYSFTPQPPRSRIPTPTAVAKRRAISVAIAAPRVPSAGTGPHPRMKTGSMTMLIPAGTPTSHIAVVVSPAPCNEARNAKKRNVSGRVRRITSMYASASTNTASRAPIQ